MVRAGETGGMLDDVMLSLADTLEKQMELRGKIKSAMTYPIAVFCIVVLILSAMLIFIVPMFQKMYHDLGGTLPLPTRVLITASGLITGLWWLIVLLGDRWRLRVPALGGQARRPPDVRQVQVAVADLRRAHAQDGHHPVRPHVGVAHPRRRADHGVVRHRG